MPAGASVGIPWTLIAAVGKVATDHGRRDPFNPDWEPGDPIGNETGPQGIFMIDMSSDDDLPEDPHDIKEATFWLARRIAEEYRQVFNEQGDELFDPESAASVDAMYAAALSELPLSLTGGSGGARGSFSSGEVQRVLVIGDSLTVGSQSAGLRTAFTDAGLPAPIIDARVGRPINEGIGVLAALSPQSGDLVVFALGTNDDGTAEQVERKVGETMAAAGDANVLWVNVDQASWAEGNAVLLEATSNYSNLVVADWAAEAAPNPNWRASDNIHYTSTGYDQLAAFVADAASSSASTVSPVVASPFNTPGSGPIAGPGGNSLDIPTADPDAIAVGDGQVFIPVAAYPKENLYDSWGTPRSGGRSHKGIDIIAPIGVPVIAMVAGVVDSRFDVGQKCPTTGALPKTVSIDGDDGNRYYYAHLDTIEVTAGQRVIGGQRLGTVGDTGNACVSVPHLHFSINESKANPINPYPILMGGLSVDAAKAAVGSDSPILLWARAYGGLVRDDERPTPNIVSSFQPLGAFTGDEADVVEIIRSIFPADQVANAVKIARAESGLDPNINNAGVNRDNSVDWGLFQLNDGTPSGRAGCETEYDLCRGTGTLQELYNRALEADSPEDIATRYIHAGNTPQVSSLDELQQLALDPVWSTSAAAQLWSQKGGGVQGWASWCSASKVLGIRDVC